MRTNWKEKYQKLKSEHEKLLKASEPYIEKYKRKRGEMKVYRSEDAGTNNWTEIKTGEWVPKQHSFYPYVNAASTAG